MKTVDDAQCAKLQCRAGSASSFFRVTAAIHKAKFSFRIVLSVQFRESMNITQLNTPPNLPWTADWSMLRRWHSQLVKKRRRAWAKDEVGGRLLRFSLKKNAVLKRLRSVTPLHNYDRNEVHLTAIRFQQPPGYVYRITTAWSNNVVKRYCFMWKNNALCL